MLRIKKSEFVTSVGKNGGYPSEGGAEIAIVGKSNVGKSSIINSLCNMNKLAKTSQKPGKTRLINYFRINGDFYIVDLPGYGFAQASKQEQAQWGELIESYLASGIATKADKLAKTRRKQVAVARARELGAPPYAIAYSSETGDGRSELLERLEAVAYGDIIGHDSETEADSNPSAPAAETISASEKTPV